MLTFRGTTQNQGLQKPNRSPQLIFCLLPDTYTPREEWDLAIPGDAATQLLWGTPLASLSVQTHALLPGAWPNCPPLYWPFLLSTESPSPHLLHKVPFSSVY